MPYHARQCHAIPRRPRAPRDAWFSSFPPSLLPFPSLPALSATHASAAGLSLFSALRSALSFASTDGWETKEATLSHASCVAERCLGGWLLCLTCRRGMETGVACGSLYGGFVGGESAAHVETHTLSIWLLRNVGHWQPATFFTHGTRLESFLHTKSTR
ncbi:hypothetical protein JOL62DRAFT_574815 [Phyllosticta paracitricarpa]|uniref:Uncharacterized protein n=1 Tax=Phyllosticta paracitricarpa TaxID=2016321 RepID=A0ABR1N9R7_9PEZI